MRPFHFGSRLLAACLMLGLSSFAPAQQAAQQDGVRYLAGGVGADAREAMRTAARDYNVRFSFSAGGDEHYVPDVHLTVRDGLGQVFDLRDAGPLLFLELEAGGYLVQAEYRGMIRTHHLHVSGNGSPARVFFHFPAG